MSLPVTEDTPPDMLAGSMDLKVVLPDGRSVKMSVQRGTPMMDLLVQATTAHCLSPGDYSLQPMGDRGVLPFKPSTPIGALDTFTVKIVQKKPSGRGRAPQVPQSFLNTFRLQVHLPRSQLFVLRVTPDVTLSEIMSHVCTEKNLSAEKYEFRNPANLDEVLHLERTLGDYKLQELSMVSKGSRTVTALMSSADVINLKASKQRQNSVCDSSLSSGSFGSRSASPIPPIGVVTAPPQPPIRKKRRPAPKPPTFDGEKKGQSNGSVLISHSRESSDSSGYHEASVLSESPTHGSPAGGMESDSPPDTLPRRSKLPPSQSFTNLASIHPPPKGRLTNSVSNTSLNSNGLYRKKRAPPPPPPSQHPNPNTNTLSQQPSLPSPPAPPAPPSPPTPPTPSAPIQHTKVAQPEVSAAPDVEGGGPPTPRPRTLVPRTPPSEEKRSLGVGIGGDGGAEDGRVEGRTEEVGRRDGGVVPEMSDPSPQSDHDPHDSITWEYQLPPPPTDFRDSHSPTCTDYATVTIHPDVLENVADNTCTGDRRFPHKSPVMTELTNILHGRQQQQQQLKEKSLSVSELYIEESGVDCRRSLSRESEGVWSGRDVENGGLEKSRSMECVGGRGEGWRGTAAEVFRKPVAPVQKKAKVAKRSASSVGTERRDSSEEQKMQMLREQFLEFLKEKKLSSELKSLDVIRNILPELSGKESRVKAVREDRREEKGKGKGKEVETRGALGGLGERERERERDREEARKRYSYQGPPSINFGTWGERPRSTKIVIKDEDYVTCEKVREKRSEQVRVSVGVEKERKEAEKKPAQVVIKKKPGVLSRYEMFSALPRRKEVSSLELVQMEDEERKRREEAKRAPVVCGMELKKTRVKEEEEEEEGEAEKRKKKVEAEVKGKHSVSVYVNGGTEVGKREEAVGVKYVQPKRNPLVMPVVKGFRGVKEGGGMNGVSVVRVVGVSGGVKGGKTGKTEDPRGDLLEEIRNFGGLGRLKRTGMR